jgi:hypothetical protein
MFQLGCPMCGYSAPPPPKAAKTPRIKQAKTKEYHVTESLPFWTYAITFIALIIIVALLSWFITK